MDWNLLLTELHKAVMKENDSKTLNQKYKGKRVYA